MYDYRKYKKLKELKNEKDKCEFDEKIGTIVHKFGFGTNMCECKKYKMKQYKPTYNNNRHKKNEIKDKDK